MSIQNPTLPPGENDPNKLYIAVGRAIHAWESMEESFARLYAAMKGLPERPDALSDYGTENNRFGKRADALQEAADAYFISAPDQYREAELTKLITDARDMSIKRHRIAHGHVTQWGEFQIPQGRGHHEIDVGLLYRWGAPWYSMVTLRTDPIGGDAASIDIAHKEFEALHNRIVKFISEMRRP
jgi:hypothetical protein